MFIETVPNRNSPPAVLLRESYRDENGKAQKRTVANLSKLPAGLIAGLKGLLKGGVVLGEGDDGLSIERSLPHGHVAAGLGMIRKIALDRLMLSTAKDDASVRHRDLIVGLIVDRLVAPRSKLGFVRAINGESANTSLGEVLALGKVAEREVYEALDWLLTQQERIENGLARRHLKGGHWCCTMSALPIWKDVIVRWPAMAIAATIAATGLRSSTAFCVRARGWRWRWRCSRAIAPTPRR